MASYLDKTGLSSVWSKMKDKMYPVGSIYISTNSTSPASIYGGTWTQIKDGFLLSAGCKIEEWEYVCDEGATFTLSETTTVRFRSGIKDRAKVLNAGTYTAGIDTFGIDPAPNEKKIVEKWASKTVIAGSTGGKPYHIQTISEMAEHFHNQVVTASSGGTMSGRADFSTDVLGTMGRYLQGVDTNPAGQSKKFEIMPPYLAVYMWKRTA